MQRPRTAERAQQAPPPGPSAWLDQKIRETRSVSTRDHAGPLSAEHSVGSGESRGKPDRMPPAPGARAIGRLTAGHREGQDGFNRRRWARRADARPAPVVCRRSPGGGAGARPQQLGLRRSDPGHLGGAGAALDRGSGALEPTIGRAPLSGFDNTLARACSFRGATRHCERPCSISARPHRSTTGATRTTPPASSCTSHSR